MKMKRRTTGALVGNDLPNFTTVNWKFEDMRQYVRHLGAEFGILDYVDEDDVLRITSLAQAAYDLATSLGVPDPSAPAVASFMDNVRIQIDTFIRGIFSAAARNRRGHGSGATPS
jgi:hypothetical protein